MIRIDLGQAANTFANLGVIVGIAFLVFELRQNNELIWNSYKPRARADFVDFVDEYVIVPGPYQ